jgi:transcriptional regulator with XRE-family HTH domain
MSDSLKSIGEQIEKTRKELQLTQIQLAELAGISYRPLYLIEDGKSIRLETLVQICDALGLRVTLAPKGGMTLD